jgi:hypothetical protein
MERNSNTPRSTTVLSSYFNIYILFARDGSLDNGLIRCIYDWGLQLKIRKEKLDAVQQYPESFEYRKPGNKYAALEQLFDLVYMIYLDSQVEDMELQVLMIYAKKLGLPPYIVGDLVKAIVTAPYDGIPYSQVKDELRDLLETSLG